MSVRQRTEVLLDSSPPAAIDAQDLGAAPRKRSHNLRFIPRLSMLCMVISWSNSVRFGVLVLFWGWIEIIIKNTKMDLNNNSCWL